MLTGAELLLNDSAWIKKLKYKKVAYLGHSASVDQKGELVLSLLLKQKEIKLASLFSPQHGFFSTKQANMITTENSSYKNVKLYSLYSEKTRRLNSEMKKSFDILLFDLQDAGCRIYTYLTTLFYLVEDCEEADKTLIVLDRPNPLGRYVEGNLLKDKFQSFVGAAPLPMSHGLTLGELALWYKSIKQLKTDVQVIWMKDYKPKQPWEAKRPWLMPSPNMTGLSCVQCYPGTVLLEGTTISEGRGTTKPFEFFGRPNIDTGRIKQFMLDRNPSFLKGCFLREVEFEPVFDKFKQKTCSGFQIHLEKTWAKEGSFRPYRLVNLFLKAFRHIHSSYSWKAKPPYEYEYQLDPIDIISGSGDLQKWVEDKSSSVKEWDEFLLNEESKWKKERKDFVIYK